MFFHIGNLYSFTGLPPWWSEVLFVCVLRPALARGLPSRASVVIWVFFSRELVGLNFPNCLRIRLLWRFTAFAVRQNRKKCLYLGHIAEFERRRNYVCEVKTEERAGLK